MGNRAGGPLLRSGSQTRLRRGNVPDEAPARIYNRTMTTGTTNGTGLDYTDRAVRDRANARLGFDQTRNHGQNNE